jgi:uncharacterized protein involved in exopolysaccharide biosynthesis
MSETENQELIALEHFERMTHYWWLILAAALIGALLGFAINRARPPIYEAQAVLTANIDFNKVDFLHPPTPTPPPYKLTQYDEDLSLETVKASLLSVVPQVVEFAQQNGLSLDANDLMAQSTIERLNALWELRFRSANPVTAQKIVNYWAQAGYEDLQARQKSGRLPAYVLFDLIQKADLTASPTYFQTNVFVLAGGLIGIIAGIFIVNFVIKGSRITS